ncbi:MAG TPA: T9SS type A sorting domain-containing protein, partial [Flavobacteriales bacterium]|nr:T9SS type A sorting domain-containing protein [Flavobacteriales bacterium]
LAFIYANDYSVPSSPLAGLSILQQRANSVRQYFNSNSTPCGAFTLYNALNEIQQEQLSFNVYPNPANNVLTISLEKLKEGTTYSIYDVLGNALISGDINHTRTIVDVSGIATGIYVLEIANETQRSSKRIVVKR